MRPGRALLAAAAIASLVAVVIAVARHRRPPPSEVSAAPPREATHPPHTGAARVWIVDDGVRVGSRDGAHPAMGGSAIWSPGDGVRLFALPGETIALQVVVSAGDAPRDGITVDMAPPRGPGGATARVERFVVYELPMARRSGGKTPRESLGWSAAAAPPGPPPGGPLPDPLVPIALAAHPAARAGASPWDYPLTVRAGRHRVVWIDVAWDAAAPPGRYASAIEVPGVSAPIPVAIEVGPVPLPYRAARNMVFFQPELLIDRVGPGAVDHYARLAHQHHLTPILVLRSADDLRRHRRLLDGSLFTGDYEGPGAGAPTDVVVIGCYGTLGDPSPDAIARVDEMLRELEAMNLADEPGTRDVFLYAVDEACDSPRGPAWRAALDASDSDRLRRLRVGHTCSRPPADQPVDLVMMFAPAFRPALARSGREADKRVWIYNGALPRTGAFLTDGWPISLRANAWIQAHHGIERWFYWESTFWSDDNRGGLGPYDPWATAETFHNDDGDHCNGDGVLVYPGRQRDRPEWLDLGFEGVIPSIRLKQWRRGIQDAGYLALAAARDAPAARAISAQLVGDAFAAEDTPRFPTDGPPWLEARRALFELIRE